MIDLLEDRRPPKTRLQQLRLQVLNYCSQILVDGTLASLALVIANIFHYQHHLQYNKIIPKRFDNILKSIELTAVKV